MKIVDVSKRNWTFLRSTGILFVILLLTMSSITGQTQQDLELLKRLASQKQQEAILEAETIDVPDDTGPTLTEIDIPEKANESDYFGYSFFRPSQSIELFNNLPSPNDYVLGPGDEVVLTLWGETELISTHVISRAGSIYIERVGLVHLSGKTITEAEGLLKAKLSGAYSTLKGNYPKTFFDLSLGELKAINVKFVGEVSGPGMHPIHPFSTVTTGLMQVGGVDTTGSLRNIQVLRGGLVVSVMDLYAFLLRGKVGSDIRLQDQDVVFVPVRESDVHISGEVRRSGIYEMKEVESLMDLVDYSGGFKATARSPLMVRRIDPLALRKSEDTPRTAYSVYISDLNNWNCQTGDSVYVPYLLPEERKISIRGQVKNPGIYVYQDSMSVLDALKMAGGIDDPNFLPSMYMERGEILRKNSEGEHALILSFSLADLIRGDESQNITLQNYDLIIIRRSEFFDEPEEVTIEGEVIIPGVYSIRKNDESLQNIIDRAGGFSSRAFPDGMLLKRDNMRVVLKDYSVSVKNGDEITVPRRKNTVEVRGEVYSPALIHFDKGMSYNDYIESAGGYTESANKSNVSVIYPNGDIRVMGFLRKPKVVEGSIIVVHREPESLPFDLTATLRDAASIVASLATIIFVLSR
ncbi:MAG: SLBB domain-containing protein [Candidatus Marinimicrobia bacterium]|nr:SLBB domain-containing protein [Candidatus Neomarinimicrobiota bacterium]MCF7850195.1 SLBB domain-containing protein [Candidatus Neomarinimicrobiota bacterium]